MSAMFLGLWMHWLYLQFVQIVEFEHCSDYCCLIPFCMCADVFVCVFKLPQTIVYFTLFLFAILRKKKQNFFFNVFSCSCNRSYFSQKKQTKDMSYTKQVYLNLRQLIPHRQTKREMTWLEIWDFGCHMFGDLHSSV